MKCIFSLQDAICSGLFAISLFAGAVSNAAYSSDNADNYDDLNCDNPGSRFEDLCNDLATVRDAEGATAVSFSVICRYVMYLMCDCVVKQCTVISAAMHLVFKFAISEHHNI